MNLKKWKFLLQMVFIKKNDIVGKHLENYDSILMLSHFKDYKMAGMGGALKNMSIDIASTKVEYSFSR